MNFLFVFEMVYLICLKRKMKLMMHVLRGCVHFHAQKMKMEGSKEMQDWLGEIYGPAERKCMKRKGF